MVNCPNCGTSNLDNASICVNCGRSLGAAAASSYTPPPPSYAPPPPPAGAYGGGGPVGMGPKIFNWLWPAIVVTICCCPGGTIFGIIGIVFSAQVNSKLAAGDVAGAQDSANKAKMFVLIGLGVAILLSILSFMFNGAEIMRQINEGANR